MSISNKLAVAAAALSVVCGTFFGATEGRAEAIASPWIEGFNNKSRLHAGRAVMDGKDGLFAAIEIAMPDGWKTYWRVPGDAGGIPPEFDFSASENLSEARVLYPAPQRLFDKAGATIGYKDRAVFPFLLLAKDAAKPIALKLKAAYGVCKELCVPAEAELEIDVPADAAASSVIGDAVSKVPRAAPIEGRDPILKSWRVEERGGKPALVIEVAVMPLYMPETGAIFRCRKRLAKAAE
jgi:DsbC/DsbD-like thiol-disulfide interchange protein